MKSYMYHFSELLKTRAFTHLLAMTHNDTRTLIDARAHIQITKDMLPSEKQRIQHDFRTGSCRLLITGDFYPLQSIDVAQISLGLLYHITNTGKTTSAATKATITKTRAEFSRITPSHLIFFCLH